MIRSVNTELLTENIKEMCIQANHYLAPDMEKAMREAYDKESKPLLAKINEIGLGPAGLGGDTTALAVNINTYATHIAGLPVAVNMCCHVNRHIVRTI